MGAGQPHLALFKFETDRSPGITLPYQHANFADLLPPNVVEVEHDGVPLAAVHAGMC